MDWMDFVLKFSGELSILVLSLSVAGLNLFYFTGSRASEFKDQSLAASFLNHHPSLNPKLYATNSQMVTVVSNSSILPQAQAENFIGLDGLSAAANASDGSEIVLGDETTILAPNPDGVQALVEKQVKIYETESGDTLASIAQKFGISQQTIMWANKLSSSNIKPGWFLLILPTNGVLVKATSNDTLPDIAAKYNPQRYNSNKKVRDDEADKLLDLIISYNALANAEDIEGGQLIIVPGGAITQAPQPTPAPRSTKRLPSGASDAITSINKDGYDGAGHIFPKGYCTWYVATRTKITFGGNAKNWLANAKASGYVTGKEPAANSVVVTTDNRYYGHVAYVEEITDTAILVSEMNYVAFNKINQRWIPRNSKTIRGYIYP